MSTEPPIDSPPSSEERRDAVIRAMAQAPGLVRFAARYTRSIHDAEDAYQRAMEIALKRAPVVEDRAFIAWLHAVIRNEAFAIARDRRREGPAPGDDLATTLTTRAEQALGPDAVAEWRERYRGIRSALNALTESQRVCLMLRSAGATYAEIASMTGFSSRKVERSVLEGRAALHGWELRMARGDECANLLPALERVAQQEASRRDQKRVERHVKTCQACRMLLGRRREAAIELASLVPPALLAATLLPSRPPDPSHAVAWWDRIAAGATVRAGTAWQSALELPGMLGTKVGAGAAAAVVAGVAGGPFVADAVRRGDSPPPRAPAALVQPIVTPSPRPPSPVVRHETAARRSRITPDAGGGRRTTPRARRTAQSHPTPRPPAASSSPRPMSPPPAPPRAASLEFGP